MKITGPTIKATKNDSGAFIRAIESEIKGVTRDTKRMMNWMLNGDGTGALAYWTTADDTSGTTVDDSQANPFINLQTGTTYDLVATSDHTTLHGTGIVVTVGAKAATNYAVTWTGTVSGSADNDYLVPSGTMGLNMMGIGGVISNTDPPNAGGNLANGLHGLAAATNQFW